MTPSPHDYFASAATNGECGVVLIPEWWGLVDHIKDVADRFSREGFHAVAVDIFDGETAEDADQGRALARSLDPQVAMTRVRRAAESLGSAHGLPAQCVGVIGWCMGGSLAFRYAVEDGLAGAVVGFYGSPPPVDQLIGAPLPTLGMFGEADQVYPAETIRAAAEELRRSPAPHRFVLAKAAGHAYFNDTRDSYEPDTAAWAWETVLLWFRQWLSHATRPDGQRSSSG